MSRIYTLFNKIITAIKGKAAADHTHPYAGSAEAGGAANSVAHNLIAGSKKFDGSKDVTITASDLGANYAAMTSEEAIAGTSTTNKVISAKVLDSAIDAAIEALPEPMLFKGSLGTDGTITALPAAAAANTGFTYKVITAGTYAEQKAKVGDTFISDGTSWILSPSGDEPSGTVTSVAIKATSPIAVDNDAAVTTSGTRTISHAASGVTAAAKGDTANQAPAFGGTFKVPSGTVNATGHLTVFADHTVTIPSATATGDAPGLMSAADKTKLDGIAGGATASKLYGSTGTATDGAMTQKATTDALAGKAAAEHTHPYAGSAEAGGAANSVAHNLIAGSKKFDGSKDVTLTAADVGAAAASHTHSKFGAQKVSDDQNLDDYHGESYIGFYYAGGGNTVTGGPAGTSAFGLLVARSAAGQFIQVYWTIDGTEWRRIYLSTGGAWSAWWKVYDTGHKPTASDVGALAVDGKAKSAAAADAVPWSGVTGKPTISVSEETLIFQ